MTFAVIKTRALVGLSALPVTVEVHLSNGLPRLYMVGMPETAVRESKDRVRSAIINSKFEVPCKRITINLAPADLPKEGSGFDLPIAIGILVASKQLLTTKLDELELIGELGLGGDLRHVRGILPMVLASRAAKHDLLIPSVNEGDATLVTQSHVYAAPHLLAVCNHLTGEESLPVCTPLPAPESSITSSLNVSDIKGQHKPKRALEIAAAGKHSMLLMGPPGTGKTMLASRLMTILPLLTEEQALEVAAIASLSSQGFKRPLWRQRPFRTPHHTSSSVALVGGGRPPKPGEISLAHQGVLFLDELPEFPRAVLETLREPLESGEITISRAAYQMQYPAQFQLIAAMNPCPCGYAGSPLGRCECTRDQIQRYRHKISGPLLDRIDMHVEVHRVSFDTLSNTHLTAETNSLDESAKLRKQVEEAHARQYERQGYLNSQLSNTALQRFAQVSSDAEKLLVSVMKQFDLSARAYHKMLKLARTIADLAKSDSIQTEHVAEAIGFRLLDRQNLTYKSERG